MRYIELTGSWRQIGRRHGEAFADDIRRCYEFYCVRYGKTPDKLHPTIRSYVETRLPNAAEEIEGIAEGAGMTYEEVLVYNHFNVITGCTPIFFRRSNVGVLVAQNLDCEREELQAVVVRKVRPTKGHAFLGVSFVGTVWVGNFINDAGLCGAGVSAHHEHYRTEDGTSGGIVGAAVAQQAGSVDEAFEIMNSHRNLGKVGVHLLATPDGRAILVEGDADRKYRTDVTGDFAFTTGLYTTGHVQARDEPAYIRPKVARAKTIEALYRSGEIAFTVAGMKAVLGHHAADPGSICRHDPRHGQCTQSGRILIAGQGKLLITEGPPCTAAFQEFALKGQ